MLYTTVTSTVFLPMDAYTDSTMLRMVSKDVIFFCAHVALSIRYLYGAMNVCVYTVHTHTHRIRTVSNIDNNNDTKN